MKVVVRFTAKQEKLALPIILRGDPATVLRERMYILSERVIERLTKAGVEFTELGRESSMDVGAYVGERI